MTSLEKEGRDFMILWSRSDLDGGEEKTQQICRRCSIGGMAGSPWRLCCHSEGLRQAKELRWQESKEVQRKAQSPALRKENLINHYVLGFNLLESHSTKEAFGVLSYKQLTRSHQCVWQSAAFREEKHWQRVKGGESSPPLSTEGTEFRVLCPDLCFPMQ